MELSHQHFTSLTAEHCRSLHTDAVFQTCPKVESCQLLVDAHVSPLGFPELGPWNALRHPCYLTELAQINYFTLPGTWCGMSS